MKTCERCLESKPLPQFNQAKTEDGRSTRCRACIKEEREMARERNAAYEEFTAWLDTLTINVKPKECKRGHPQTPDNQRAWKQNGKTYYACIACDRIRKMNRQASKYA